MLLYYKSKQGKGKTKKENTMKNTNENEQFYSTLIDNKTNGAIKREIAKTRTIIRRLKKDVNEKYWTKEDADEDIKLFQNYIAQVNSRTKFVTDIEGKIISEPADEQECCTA
jgi:DNA-binding transcriptional regulator GbsR (MarR family)